MRWCLHCATPTGPPSATQVRPMSPSPTPPHLPPFNTRPPMPAYASMLDPARPHSKVTLPPILHRIPSHWPFKASLGLRSYTRIPIGPSGNSIPNLLYLLLNPNKCPASWHPSYLGPARVPFICNMPPPSATRPRPQSSPCTTGSPSSPARPAARPTPARPTASTLHGPAGRYAGSLHRCPHPRTPRPRPWLWRCP
jgi:hypothetical protein